VVHPSCTENGRTVVWKDLAKFDHRNSPDREGLFAYCLSIVEFLVGLGCRGFRCDAAYQVPSGVWQRLIREVRRKHPDVRFFAETLGCPPDQTRHTAEAGFDYIFNSSKWWDFQAPWLLAQYHLTRDIAPSISFPESHDTPRLCEELQGNVAGLKQRYLFAALFSGGLMMPAGYEYGFRTRLHVVRTCPAEWEEIGIDLREFVARVNRLKAAHAVLQEEAPIHMLNHLNPGIVLIWKGSVRSREECLMIINRDIYNPQPFFAPRLHDFIQAGTQMVDVSPEHPLDYIPQPFAYDLQPGQILVFIANREPVRDS
jgi:starch synthase (maltosyl-transferring)